MPRKPSESCANTSTLSSKQNSIHVKGVTIGVHFEAHVSVRVIPVAHFYTGNENMNMNCAKECYLGNINKQDLDDDWNVSKTFKHP